MITKQPANKPPVCTQDLLPSERELLKAANFLRFGRIEQIPVRGGKLFLEENAKFIKVLKLGTASSQCEPPEDFTLRASVVQLFAQLRNVNPGMVRVLEVRHGLPFSVELEETVQAEAV